MLLLSIKYLIEIINWSFWPLTLVLVLIRHFCNSFSFFFFFFARQRVVSSREKQSSPILSGEIRPIREEFRKRRETSWDKANGDWRFEDSLSLQRLCNAREKKKWVAKRTRAAIRLDFSWKNREFERGVESGMCWRVHVAPCFRVTCFSWSERVSKNSRYTFGT